MTEDITDSWLDPNGKIIPVYYCEHNDYAKQYLLDTNPQFDRNTIMEYCESLNCRQPYQVLHKQGWIRIRIRYMYLLPIIQVFGNGYEPRKIMQNTIDPAMNKVQIQVVKRLCEKLNVDFLDAINGR